MHFIEDYQRHFVVPHTVVPIVKTTSSRKKNKLLNDFDKLFFHFLLTMKYAIPFDYTKREERMIKYNMTQEMESFKFKNKDSIVNHFCYEDSIDLRCLSFLSTFYSINIIYSYGKVVMKMLHNDDMPIYLLNEHKEFVLMKSDKYNDVMNGDYFEIKDICKPLYSMSHYKVEELKDMVGKLDLYIDKTKVYKKKDYYEMIEHYLKSVLF